MKDFISKVVEIYKPFKKAVFIVFCFALFSQIIFLVAPYLYGKIIDGLIEQQPMKEVLLLACMAFLVYVAGSLVGYFQEKFELEKFSFDISRHIARLTLKKVFSFSVGQHNSQNSGIKQSIIHEGEHSLTILAYLVLYEALPVIFRVLCCIGALLYLSTTLGLIVFLGVFLFLGITVILNLTFAGRIKEFVDMSHDQTKIHTEMLRNVELIQLSAQEEKTIDEYSIKHAQINVFGKKMWTRYVFFEMLRDILLGLSKFAVLVLGIYYVYQGFYTPGYLVIFLSWSNRAFEGLGRMGSIHRRSLSIYAAVKKYFAMLDTKPDVVVVKNPIRASNFLGRIEFEDVSFAYPVRSGKEGTRVQEEDRMGTKGALSHLNFIIEQGQRVAFVGQSGAGKSTIIHLLTRAYDPNDGKVLIDDNNLRLIDLSQYRKNIGLVEQDVALFDDTLRYNITFGLDGNQKSTNDTNLQRIAQLSCIDKFYPRLENGFDTIIGEKGVKLSGGERQRVSIARALIKNPTLLIFDEATSSLDTENESRIQHSIEEASKGRTTVIIAHRLSTIKNVDKIFVLDGGMIVGEGTHAQLMNSCGQYQKLVNHQILAA